MARAVAERKSTVVRIASEFEKNVDGIVAGAALAATEMQRSARSLSAIAKETTRQSGTVTAAAQQPAANLQTVAAAAAPTNLDLGVLRSDHKPVHTLQNITLDHPESGISRDQTCKWGIEWDLCALQILSSKERVLRWWSPF